MKITKGYQNNTLTNKIMNSIPMLLIMGVIGICLGLLFICSQSSNKPIERDGAVSYSGLFERYEALKNYRTIYFTDGSCYSVYPHTDNSKFSEKIKSLDKGTKLYITVNPNNGYVAEVKTDTEELMNFEASQKAIDTYDNGYIVIGYVACAAGVFLIIYAIGSIIYRRKENARHDGKSS